MFKKTLRWYVFFSVLFKKLFQQPRPQSNVKKRAKRCTGIEVAVPDNRTEGMNAIFGILSLSLWLFEIISGVPICIFMIYFWNWCRKIQGKDFVYLVHEQKYLQQIYLIHIYLVHLLS